MSLSTDSTQGAKAHVTDLIAERRRNKTRVTMVRNIHAKASFCHINPNELGTVSPMDALRYRAWLRPVTCDEEITDDELLGIKPKRKEAPKKS